VQFLFFVFHGNSVYFVHEALSCALNRKSTERMNDNNPKSILLAALITAATAFSSLGYAAVTPVLRTDTRQQSLPAEAQRIAEWAVRSGDHRGYPFIVVDKVHAVAAAFDRAGKLLQVTPILIGMGVGDVFEPGVLQMDMYATKPSQRITPAGRFFSEEDLNLEGQRVLWVDYDAGIALHKIPTKRTKQRRQERMKSANPEEHRITYGCINVPPAFYDQVVGRHFRAKGGIVYVLPDSTPLKAVFKSYDVAELRKSSAGDTTPALTPETQRF
jgi:hypothetical protein